MLAFEQVIGSDALLPARQLWIASGVTLAFASIARLMRGVTRSGAVAGAAVCFLLYAGAGPGAFLALVSVFVLTWLTTRWGYQRKQKLGTAERSDGRTASQVLANLGVAAMCAALHGIRGGSAIYSLALAGALSEAAADTVSSEVGQAAGAKARLVTSWQPVPSGTDGGVSLPGTLAGITGALAVSSVCALSGLVRWRVLGVPAGAGACGMLADSYMGALLERRGLLNNDAVNFLSTLFAVATVFLLA